MTAAAMTIMACTLAINVFCRFVLDSSLTWAEELSGFAFLWMMFFASSLAAKQRSHIRVTALVLLLPKKFRIFVIAAADAIWVVFNGVFVYCGIQVVENAMRYREISPVLGVNMTWMYLVMPTSVALMTVRIVVGYWRQFRGKEEGYDF